MDKKLKRKWIKALRSGEYQQGMGALREVEEGTDRFCCLGVLCDVYDPDEWIVRESPPTPTILEGGITFMDMDYAIGDHTLGGGVSSSSLPHLFRDLIGMSLDEMNTLMTLNDDQKLSFNEIADWIEAYIPDH